MEEKEALPLEEREGLQFKLALQRRDVPCHIIILPRTCKMATPCGLVGFGHVEAAPLRPEIRKFSSGCQTCACDFVSD